MRRAIFAAFFGISGLAAAGCGDPAHEDAVSALGGEKPGVPEGELHRPGQPCVTCHQDSGPAEAVFSIGGTVYLLRNEDRPAAGATVQIEDMTGTVLRVITNAAGNFWLLENQWAPTFPIQMKVTLGNVSRQMSTHVGRSGSCADCHLDPPSQTSPGHVFIATSEAGLAGPMKK